MIAALLALSLAARAGGAAYLGWSLDLNDPFVERVGLHLSGEVSPQPHLGFGGEIGYYPALGADTIYPLGAADWKPLLYDLVNLGIYPDITHLRLRAALPVRLSPVVYQTKHRTMRASLYAGPAAVQVEYEPEPCEVCFYGGPVVDIVPALSWGVSGEIRKEWLSARFRLDHLSYVQPFVGGNVGTARRRALVMEVGAWW